MASTGGRTSPVEIIILSNNIFIQKYSNGVHQLNGR
jgi:hypothetical protein